MSIRVVTDGTGIVDAIEGVQKPKKHIDMEGILLSLAGIGCLVTGCAFIFFTEFWYTGLGFFFATLVIAAELYLGNSSQNRVFREKPGEESR